jgi:hypothetical protein
MLLTPPRSDLNPPEVEDLMKKVGDALARAAEGNPDEVGTKLSEVGRHLDEKLDDDARNEARSILETIAESIDVELDRD